MRRARPSSTPPERQASIVCHESGAREPRENRAVDEGRRKQPKQVQRTRRRKPARDCTAAHGEDVVDEDAQLDGLVGGAQLELIRRANRRAACKQSQIRQTSSKLGQRIWTARMLPGSTPRISVLKKLCMGWQRRSTRRRLRMRLRRASRRRVANRRQLRKM